MSVILADALGNVRVRFWSCEWHLRGRVVWRFGVAHCAEPQCDRTSVGPCGCDRAVMVGLSPMHPDTYLYLACPFHRSIEFDIRHDRQVRLAKQEARNCAQRRAHEVAEDLGLIPRCCHNTEWVDGMYPTRCGRTLDDQGRCPRCDR